MGCLIMGYAQFQKLQEFECSLSPLNLDFLVIQLYLISGHTQFRFIFWTPKQQLRGHCSRWRVGGNARVEQRLLSLEEGFNTFKEFTEQQQKAFLFAHGWTNSRNLIWNDVHVMFRYCWVSSSQVFLGLQHLFFHHESHHNSPRFITMSWPWGPTDSCGHADRLC